MGNAKERPGGTMRLAGRRARDPETPLVFEMDDGSKMTVGAPALDTEILSAATSLTPILPGRFSVCPICRSAEADSAEDVPPKSIGGKPVTNTCLRCNNILGSVLEKQVPNWYRYETAVTAFSHVDVRGIRKTSSVQMLETTEGASVVLIGEKFDEDIRSKFREGGEFTLHFSTPDMKRLSFAFLKSAYLAACMALRGIPNSLESQKIRNALIFVRDNPKAPLPECDAAANLRIGRVKGDRPKPRGNYLTWVPTLEDVGILLASSLVLSWPISDLRPAWYSPPAAKRDG